MIFTPYEALMAVLNFGLCMGIVFVSICRLNAMGPDVLWRVRSEYAGLIGGAMAAAVQPWWNEMPEWGALALAAGMLNALYAQRKAWRHDTPPIEATDHAPLSEPPSER